MKLSIGRKPGWVQVRGGRVRKVVREHRVHAHSQNALDGETPRKPFTQPMVLVKEGDLALEIIAVATGKVLGHAYLSGDAIQLNAYNTDPTWYGDAIGMRADFAPLIALGPERVGPGLLELKFATECDLIVADIQTNSVEETFAAKDFIMTVLSTYVPEDKDMKGLADVFFTISHSQRAGHVATIHSQPPDRAQGYGVPPFVMEMALRSTEIAACPFPFLPADKIEVVDDQEPS